MSSSKVFRAIDNDDPDELASSLLGLGTSAKSWGPFLHYATAHLALKSTTYLVNSGVNVNSKDFRGYTPLLMMWLNDEDPHDSTIETISEILVREGADVTLTDDMGMTVLHYVCRRGSLKMVRLFLLKGADPHAENSHGLTPMNIVQANLFSIGPQNGLKFKDLLTGADR